MITLNGAKVKEDAALELKKELNANFISITKPDIFKNVDVAVEV